MSYWLLLNKYLIVSIEITSFFQGKIFNRASSPAWSTYWWGGIIVVAGWVSMNAFYFYNYLRYDDWSGTFFVTNAIGQIVAHLVPVAILHKTQNIFMIHCEYDPFLAYSSSK